MPNTVVIFIFMSMAESLFLPDEMNKIDEQDVCKFTRKQPDETTVDICFEDVKLTKSQRCWPKNRLTDKPTD